MFYYAVLRTKKGNSGKSVKDCSASELQCVAFVRTHTNNLKGQKPSSRELMSISDLQKMVGKTKFNDLVGDYIIKPKGQPVLAPESDAKNNNTEDKQ
jgi:hypothetical protein